MRGQVSQPNSVGAPSDRFLAVQEGARYGDTCPSHIPSLLLPTSLPQLRTPSPIRRPGRHLIIPVDRSHAATSPDDVLLTSSNPDPHADVMLTSFKKSANKAKRPYFYSFSRFLLFSVKKTSVLSACKLRPAVYQPTFDHPQKLRAPTQLLFRPKLLAKQVFARPFPCKLVFSQLLIKRTWTWQDIEISPQNQVYPVFPGQFEVELHWRTRFSLRF